MIKKICFSPDNYDIETLTHEAVCANPLIISRFTKLAKSLRNIAPKSDDFLYFSIIFLKAAESALIDENGNIKKVGSEDAWGFFDENWKWHGNVKAHKNNNCFPAGTKILLENGSVKNIEDVRAGDMVISHTGSAKKVLSTMQNNYSGNLSELSIKNNEKILCTPEHPFYRVNFGETERRGLGKLNELRKRINHSTEYEFSAASELVEGDLLTSPVVHRKVSSWITPRAARLLGIFAAEGSYAKKYNRFSGINLTLGITETKQANLVKSIFEEEFPECSVRIRPQPERSVIQVFATGSKIADLFYHHIGEYSHKKTLSKEIVFGSDEVKRQFLTGWLDGDGCLTSHNKLIGITTSPNMAYQINTMLNSLKIGSSLRKPRLVNKTIKINDKYPEYKRRSHYRIEVYGDGYKRLGLDKHSVKYSFDETISHKSHASFEQDYNLHYFKKAVDVPFDGLVYNFEVEDDHSYVANGIVVHNCDIFPESELKKATAEWIGKPLCRDHESSSVDGIRGIILDTHYDEKFKQVVGLCALDKVNYPDLARKVETGMVRYGSMGTAVETSICSDCQNKATNQNEYCKCISSRAAHGEVNVGLKPIEYSLVVQPAEPGAILLKCIASLKEYKRDFTNYGVDNVSEMLGRLSLKQAEHLDGIMKTACGDNSCSIDDRDSIVRSFLENNGLLKQAFTDSSESVRNIAEALRTLPEAASLLTDPNVNQEVKNVVEMLVGKLDENFRADLSTEKTERLTTDDSSDEKGPGDVQEFSSATSRMNLNGGGDNGDLPDFAGNEDDILSFQGGGGDASTSIASSEQNQKVKTANTGGSSDFVNDFSINSIMEDIMNESRLRKRAELRRSIAYHQGGSEGVEPNTYKDEPSTYADDKHMHQDKSMGGPAGMVPGDAELKGKLSRAQLEERRLKRLAYMQGGAAGAEPSTYKSEPYTFNEDKHMKQDGNMGGDKGTFPGDAEAKAKQSRASYDGPSLSTKFSVSRALNGSVNKEASLLEVFAGDKRVIAATGRDIFGPELEANWEWLKSRDYGREVCSQIRTAGLTHVASLLKTAQELPPEAAAPMDMPTGELNPEMPMEEEMPMDLEPEMPMDDEPEEPGTAVDNRLAEIEQLIDEIRDLVGELEDGRSADVDVNVFTGEEGAEGEDMGAEMTALSSKILKNLKVAFENLDGSADELSMVAETFDNIGKLSSAQKVEFRKLASAAVKDADQATGEAKALVRFAMDMADDEPKEDMAADPVINLVDDPMTNLADDAMEEDEEVNDLVSEAMQLRRDRREAILKQAEERLKLSKKAQGMEGMEELDGAEEACDAADDAVVNEADDETAGDALADGGWNTVAADKASALKTALAKKMQEKRADDAREEFRVKLRRAYDVGLEMQSKGLLPASKASLDRQVDEIMSFDNNAFEAFKRSIGNARPVGTMKIASDLGGVNVGVTEESVSGEQRLMSAGSLLSLWDE